ncbi:lactonase family protein [Novosphingobium sp. AAP83]|uniref:lactonase family protein n=1 Tax=Novosphingobium sp. AAP83 TaxID=1523425 RepID=UPI0006B9629A|nr:lactonase family protein [Novosphingobium sp. AAP83]
MTSQAVHFYIGTQGDGPGQGIFHASLDPETGAMQLLGLAAQVRRPTWLEAVPARGLVFAVSEIGNKGECAGEVFSFAYDSAKVPLTQIGHQSAHGGGTTHLCIDSTGEALFTANFGGGQATRMAIAADGKLGPGTLSAPHAGSGPHPRQNRPHPHGVTLSPDGMFLLVPDMGNDCICIHALSPNGFADAPVTEHSLPAGSGPRLTLFDKGGRWLYLLSELSAEIFVLEWNGTTGTLRDLARVALDQPDAEGGASAAAFVMSGDGRYLYASNRRSNTVCVFKIDEQTGLPSLVQSIACGGERPWGAAISADQRWLLVANQASDTVNAFRRSPESGILESVCAAPIHVPAPTHIAFADG